MRRVGFGDARRDDERAGAASASVEANAAPPRRRWIAIAALAIWLALWGVALVVSLDTLFEKWTEGRMIPVAFLLAWVIFAAIGWLTGARVLSRLLRGEPVSRPGQGVAPSRAGGALRRDARG